MNLPNQLNETAHLYAKRKLLADYLKIPEKELTIIETPFIEYFEIDDYSFDLISEDNLHEFPADYIGNPSNWIPISNNFYIRDYNDFLRLN